MIKKFGLLLIAAFVAAFLFAYSAGEAHAAEAPGVPVISLGYTAFNSDTSVGEVAWLLPSQRWEIAATAVGHGHTKRGPIVGHVNAYSVSRLVRPRWQFLGAENYYRLGLAYVDDHPLVGRGNYRLGVGLRWRVWALEYFHYSSGGINDPNTGIDGLQLRVPITL